MKFSQTELYFSLKMFCLFSVINFKPTNFSNLIQLADVAAEKTQQTLIAGIEKFDTANLKHTETQEKNPLPDKEGECPKTIRVFVHSRHILHLFSLSLLQRSSKKKATRATSWALKTLIRPISNTPRPVKRTFCQPKKVRTFFAVANNKRWLMPFFSFAVIAAEKISA